MRAAHHQVDGVNNCASRVQRRIDRVRIERRVGVEIAQARRGRRLRIAST
jgi:hypothetical protein